MYIHCTSTLAPAILPAGVLPPAPPPTPPAPVPKFPFSTAPPNNTNTDNTPLFPSIPSPPSPPSPASFASFSANISSFNVPHTDKSKSATSKALIGAAVAAVLAAVAIVSLVVFVHLRKRGRTQGSSAFGDFSKPARSDSNSSTTTPNFHHPPPNISHIPRLQRPSQTSSEFLYLGTLVNSHPPSGGIAGNRSGNRSQDGIINTVTSNPMKLDSPELRPLPSLHTQQNLSRNFQTNNGDLASSKGDDDEEFYSPKGSLNGRESSIGTGSASRRAIHAIDVEHFNVSTSNSSSTYSSSVSGSVSGSPVRSISLSLSPENSLSPRNSIPKSPDLIDIQAIPPLQRRQLPCSPSRHSTCKESASPSPSSSSSLERYSRRSEYLSPPISDASDQKIAVAPEFIGGQRGCTDGIKCGPRGEGQSFGINLLPRQLKFGIKLGWDRFAKIK